MKKYLTVEELIKILSNLPPDAKVVTQEGMNYWHLSEAFTVEDGGVTKVLIQ
jgi:hypothetical protein